MAIRMMTSNKDLPNLEVITNYPGCETNRIAHHWECKHGHDAYYSHEKGPECTERCHFYEPLYIETTYEGCVLDTYERNGYDDSDFYAIVWDEAEQTIKHIEYASTRGWSYPNGAQVDATPEVKEKAKAYLAKQMLVKLERDNKAQAEMPYVGRKVKVVKGRKIKIGTIGEVFWFGEDQYKASGRNRYNRYNPYAGLVGKFFKDRYRIGVRYTEDGMVKKDFISAENVEVINPESYLESIGTPVVPDNTWRMLLI